MLRRSCGLLLGLAFVLLVSGAALAVALDAKVEYLGDTLPEGLEVNLGSVNDETSAPILLTPELSSAIMRYEVGLSAGRLRFALAGFEMDGEATTQGSVAGYVGEGYSYPSLWGIDERFYSDRGPFGWLEQTDYYRYVPKGTCTPELELQLYDCDAYWDPEKAGINWSASQEFDLGSWYATAQYNLVDSDRAKFALVGGVHKVDWNSRVNQQLSATAHTDHTVYTQRPGAFPEGDWESVSRTVSDRSVDIYTDAEVDYHPLGAAVGLSGDWKLTGRLHLNGSVLQSWMRDDATFKGQGNDCSQGTGLTHVDQYPLGEDPNDYSLGVAYHSDHDLGLAATAQRCEVDATEAQASLVFDFTDNVFASFGYHYARWNGIPNAPRWNYTFPDDEASSDAEWTIGETSDIELSTWKLGLGVRF